jgi:putative ABC transport system permease protein
MGNSNRRVFALIVTEGLFLGFAGAMLGSALGVTLALAVSAIGIPMPPPPNAELGYTARIQLSAAAVAKGALIGVIASGIGALGPARRISRMPIVDALRQNV